MDREPQPEPIPVPVEDVRAYIAEMAGELARLAQDHGDESLAEALRLVRRKAEAS